VKQTLTILMIMLGFCALAQGPLQYFIQVPVKSDIKLSWAINPNYSCDRMEVEHSNDSLFSFPRVVYTGTFTPSSSVMNYDFTHTGVDRSQPNYYRLNLGACGFSNTIRAINSGSTGYWLYPNPFNEFATVIFQNPLNLAVSFYVFDRNGQLLRKSAPLLGNTLLVYRENLLAGFYYFAIVHENDVLTWGKFYVKDN
jgi:hypothetical protein